MNQQSNNTPHEKDPGNKPLGKDENGLPLENSPVVPGEIDEDQLIHEEGMVEETPDMNKEQDLDDLSHTIPPAEDITTQEQDLDDLVHKTPPHQQGEQNY